jgi:hypothetical protein
MAYDVCVVAILVVEYKNPEHLIFRSAQPTDILHTEHQQP